MKDKNLITKNERSGKIIQGKNPPLTISIRKVGCQSFLKNQYSIVNEMKTKLTK